MNDLSPLTLTLQTVVHRALQSAPIDAPQAMSDVLAKIIQAPTAQDAAFLQACARCHLDLPWALVLKALVGVEIDAEFAQAVSSIQTPAGSARPTAPTLLKIARVADPCLELVDVLRAPIFKSGLAAPISFDQPLSVSPVRLAHSMLADLGVPVKEKPSLVVLETGTMQVPKPYRMDAADRVSRCAGVAICLSVRGGALRDQQSYAIALAEALGTRAVLVHDPDAAGLVPSLQFANATPVQIIEGQVGTRAKASALVGFQGPRIILTGDQGGLDTGDFDQLDLRLPKIPSVLQETLWGDPDPERPYGDIAGFGPAHFQDVSQRMRLDDLTFRQAAGQAVRARLEPHATLVDTDVPQDGLVATSELAQDLDILLARCKMRRDHRIDLGPAFGGNQSVSGIKALFAGPSGGGKTLACSWLATQLNSPLFKVDLSSVVSKYIGETEENLARILDAAEAADVMLLFDEADALFGARSEAKDSSDRYANNQTNFLLGRIETYTGIILMTTNGRQRLDSAFGRRIDQVIDVPVPDAKGRRLLWSAHLGAASQLSASQLNRLSTSADLAGGHIRSVVQTAAVLAGPNQPIDFEHICRSLAMEYRAMGRTPPATLRHG